LILVELNNHFFKTKYEIIKVQIISYHFTQEEVKAKPHSDIFKAC